jgi:hypothetical protein
VRNDGLELHAIEHCGSRKEEMRDDEALDRRGQDPWQRACSTIGISYVAGTNTSLLVALPTGKMLARCLAMNDAPGMEAMHQGMPVFLGQQCDAQHEQIVHNRRGRGLDVRPRVDIEVRKR